MSNYAPIIVYMLLAALCIAISAGTLLYDRDPRLKRSLLFLQCALLMWMLSRLMFLCTKNPLTAEILYDSDLPFVSLSAAALLLFVGSYFGSKILSSHSAAIIICLVPFITLLSLFTAEGRALVRQDVVVHSVFPNSFVSGQRGPWFWVNALYSYALILACLITTIRRSLRVPALYRRSMVFVYLGVGAVLIGNPLILLTGFGGNLDLTLIICCLSSAMLYLSARKNAGVGLLFIARHMVIDQLKDYLLVLDARGNIMFANSAAKTAMAETGEGIKTFAEWLRLLFAGATQQEAVDCEHGGRDYHLPGGQVYNVKQRFFSDSQGQAVGSIVIGANVTASRARLRELEALSGMDALTGLLNRFKIEQILEQAQEEGVFPLTIVAGDINGLKQVNDSLGHFEGDVYLRTIAEVLVSYFPPNAHIARVSGDEFLVVLPGVGLEKAQEAIGEIEAHLETRSAALAYNASIALGAAQRTDSHMPLALLQQQADAAMYHKKKEMHCAMAGGEARGGKKTAKVTAQTILPVD